MLSWIQAIQNGLHYAWYTMGGGNGVFYSQQQPGKAFSARVPVSGQPAARHPQIATTGNGRLAIVWDEQVARGSGLGSRISLQLRDPKGNFLLNLALTPDTLQAVYPVPASLADNSLLVAYTNKSKQQPEVWYTRVPLNK